VARRDDIVAFANELLEVEAFPEYGRPGLQVVGAGEVSKLACGVSSSRELFERASAAEAQLVVVHHGIFWRNEPLVIDRRLKGRLEALFAADLTLVAYHLALDAHAELGNNALLADKPCEAATESSPASAPARTSASPSRSTSSHPAYEARRTASRSSSPKDPSGSRASPWSPAAGERGCSRRRTRDTTRS
jgi:putative NIF3 family GTP cyclohydrolase 1 type 2